ncbi:ISL3 family transposase [Halosquirtibacter xylanolyticus]|uniref:ISL3 family transposase n=1 Tax=Halosquirtibacter xylanolyticus TaxID=3374599 RepID=UPI003749A9B5|nr:ISL3 family transposase [Prolixibacteraceae bacterium]
MYDLLASALHIESPYFIDGINLDKESQRLDVYIDFKRGSRFSHNGEDNLQVHDTRKKTWQHLSFFEYKCYLTARVPRVIKGDGNVAILDMPWEGELPGFTLLFEALLMSLISYMPVHQVAQMTGVYDDKLWKLATLYVDTAKAEEDHSDIEMIGVDETSCKKGHNYVTLFVDLKERKTVHVTEGKGAETIASFCKVIPHYHDQNKVIKSSKISHVSCDMSPSFISGIATHLPDASITFDKFHIMKIINEAVDKVRRSEAKDEECLKGNRYLFLKNKTNFTLKQQQAFKDLSISNSKLKVTTQVLQIGFNRQKLQTR